MTLKINQVYPYDTENKPSNPYDTENIPSIPI